MSILHTFIRAGRGYSLPLLCYVFAPDGTCALMTTALFAPGWVFENATPRKEEFDDNQHRFWHLFEVVFPPFVHTALPLVTSFDAGCGDSVHVNGQVCGRLSVLCPCWRQAGRLL